MVRTILVILALMAAMPASACGVLETADPRVGSTVAQLDHIALSFTEPLGTKSSAITLTAPNGKPVPLGKTIMGNEGKSMSATASSLPPGTYEVTWHTRWPDCDSDAKGNYKFTLNPQMEQNP